MTFGGWEEAGDLHTESCTSKLGTKSRTSLLQGDSANHCTAVQPNVNLYAMKLKRCGMCNVTLLRQNILETHQQLDTTLTERQLLTSPASCSKTLRNCFSSSFSLAWAACRGWRGGGCKQKELLLGSSHTLLHLNTWCVCLLLKSSTTKSDLQSFSVSTYR